MFCSCVRFIDVLNLITQLFHLLTIHCQNYATPNLPFPCVFQALSKESVPLPLLSAWCQTYVTFIPPLHYFFISFQMILSFAGVFQFHFKSPSLVTTISTSLSFCSTFSKKFYHLFNLKVTYHPTFFFLFVVLSIYNLHHLVPSIPPLPVSLLASVKEREVLLIIKLAR